MPQHRLPDAVVEAFHAVLALDYRRVRTPGNTVYGVIDHHVAGCDVVVETRTLKVHVAPEVEQNRAVERV